MSWFCGRIAIVVWLGIFFSPGFGFAARTIQYSVIVPPQMDLPGVQKFVILDFETKAGVQRESANQSGLSASKTWTFRDGQKTSSPDTDFGHSLSLELREGILDWKEHTAGSDVPSDVSLRSSRIEALPSFRFNREFKDHGNSIESILEAASAKGADAIVWGEFRLTASTNSWETQESNGDGEYETVDCTENDVQADVTIEVFAVEDGNSLGVKLIRFSDSSQGCGTDTFTNLDGLIDAAIEDLSKQAMNCLLPRTEKRRLAIAKPEKRKAKKESGLAFDLVENSRFEEAGMVLESIRAEFPDDSSSSYNLGVFFEIQDKLDLADSHYRSAIERGDAEEAEAALRRISRRRIEHEKLQRAGYLTPTE